MGKEFQYKKTNAPVIDCYTWRTIQGVTNCKFKVRIAHKTDPSKKEQVMTCTGFDDVDSALSASKLLRDCLELYGKRNWTISRGMTVYDLEALKVKVVQEKILQMAKRKWNDTGSNFKTFWAEDERKESPCAKHKRVKIERIREIDLKDQLKHYLMFMKRHSITNQTIFMQCIRDIIQLADERSLLESVHAQMAREWKFGHGDFVKSYIDNQKHKSDTDCNKLTHWFLYIQWRATLLEEDK